MIKQKNGGSGTFHVKLKLERRFLILKQFELRTKQFLKLKEFELRNCSTRRRRRTRRTRRRNDFSCRPTRGPKIEVEASNFQMKTTTGI